MKSDPPVPHGIPEVTQGSPASYRPPLNGQLMARDEAPHAAKALTPVRTRNRQAGGAPGQLSRLDFRLAQPAFAELPLVRPGTKAAAARYKGPVKRAALLDREAVRLAEDHIARISRSPESDYLKLRLSLRSGLRASEIADLPIGAMLNARGLIADSIQVYARKTKSRRMLPMHPEVRSALARLLGRHPEATHAAFSIGRHGVLRRQSASCVANWFFRLYRDAGLIGCSSHSGQRTFATELARLLGLYGGTSKDLQNALGHASLSSTECYLEPSNRIADLIKALGS